MGSLKAANTLRMLAARVEIKNGRIPDQSKLNKLHARVLAADLAEVRELFASVNEMLNFDPETSKATPEQLGVIRRLEKRLSGAARTSWVDAITHAQAHALIRELNAALAARRGAA